MALAVILAGLLALIVVGLAAVGGARRTHLSGRYRLLFVVALASSALAASASTLFVLALAVGILGLALAGLVGLGLDEPSGRDSARLVARYLAIAATLVGVGVQVVTAGSSPQIDGLLARMSGEPMSSATSIALVLLALAAVAGLAPLGAATLGAARRATPQAAILLLGFAPAVALMILWRLNHDGLTINASMELGTAGTAPGPLPEPLAIALGVAGALAIANGVSLLRQPRDHRLWVAGLAATLVGQAFLGSALGATDALAGALVALLVAIPLTLLAPAVAGAAGDATLVDLAAIGRRRPIEASLFVAGTAVGLGLLPAFDFAGRVPLVVAGFGTGLPGFIAVLVALVGWACGCAAALSALSLANRATKPSRRPAGASSTQGRGSVGALAVGASGLAIVWSSIEPRPGHDPAATAIVVAALATGVLLGIRARRQPVRNATPTRATILARLDKRLGSPGIRFVSRLRRVDWIETDAITLASAAARPVGRATAWLLDATFGRLARS